MKTVTIHFTSGKSFDLVIDEVERLIEMLTVSGPGKTTITGDDGTAYLINRDFMTHVEVK